MGTTPRRLDTSSLQDAMTAQTPAERMRAYRARKRNVTGVTKEWVRNEIRNAIKEAIPLIVQEVLAIVTAQRNAETVTKEGFQEERVSSDSFRKTQLSKIPPSPPMGAHGSIQKPVRIRKKPAHPIADDW